MTSNPRCDPTHHSRGIDNWLTVALESLGGIAKKCLLSLLPSECRLYAKQRTEPFADIPYPEALTTSHIDQPLAGFERPPARILPLRMHHLARSR